MTIPKEDINVLLACEESQATTTEFRKLGFNAFSCDIKNNSGPLNKYHIKGDVLEVLNGYNGIKWDLMIAHPPCTYLAVSGASWFYDPLDKKKLKKNRRPHPKFPNRRKKQEEAILFFKKLMKAPIKYIALENPISIISSKYRKPDCIVHPYHFGDEASKATCFWLKNLPLLESTKMVSKGRMHVDNKGKNWNHWVWESFCLKTTKEKRAIRSKTFPGMAKAMATQWGEYVYNNKNKIINCHKGQFELNLN